MKVEQKCQCCGKKFQAKSADVKRGWAKCCSKSCAAAIREKHLNRGKVWEKDPEETFCEEDPHPFSDEAFQSYF